MRILKIEDEWNYLGGFMDYASAVEEYSKRQLTDPKDTLFAISGILETLQDVTGRFILGLPKKHFLESLLWYPDVGCVQTHNAAMELPSWAWASCNFAQGAITFDMMDVRQLRSLLTVTAKIFHRNTEENVSSANSDKSPFSMAISLAGTYGNLLACLTTPKIDKDHTIKRLFHADGTRMRRIVFEPPMNALALESGAHSGSIPDVLLDLIELAGEFVKTGTKDWMPTTDNFPYDQHILAFETVIVRFSIGEPLRPRSGRGDDEVGIFALNNSTGDVVGEIVTTYRRARAGPRYQDFITISCGFSPKNAEIHRRWIPRWRFNGESQKDEEASLKNAEGGEKSYMQEARDAAIAMLARETGSFTDLAGFHSIVQKIEPYVPGRWLPISEEREQDIQDSAISLFGALYSAKKGEPIVRALWPVVNVMLVDWNGKIARRAGIGKVIMKAWQEQGHRPKEVLFG